jgi:hypothetical protein
VQAGGHLSHPVRVLRPPGRRQSLSRSPPQYQSSHRSTDYSEQELSASPDRSARHSRDNKEQRSRPRRR